jgi:hypothetical protein
VGDAQSVALAKRIAGALREARWVVGIEQQLIRTPPYDPGVFLEVIQPHPAANALYGALYQCGVSPKGIEGCTGVAKDKIHILVSYPS